MNVHPSVPRNRYDLAVDDEIQQRTPFKRYFVGGLVVVGVVAMIWTQYGKGEVPAAKSISGRKEGEKGSSAEPASIEPNLIPVDSSSTPTQDQPNRTLSDTNVIRKNDKLDEAKGKWQNVKELIGKSKGKIRMGRVLLAGVFCGLLAVIVGCALTNGSIVGPPENPNFKNLTEVVTDPIKNVVPKAPPINIPTNVSKHNTTNTSETEKNLWEEIQASELFIPAAGLATMGLMVTGLVGYDYMSKNKPRGDNLGTNTGDSDGKGV